MTHAYKQGRDWARQLAEQMGLPIDEIIDRILDHARAASNRGIFAPLGDYCEESRDLNAMLLHDGRIGIQVPAPDGEGDEHVVEARAFLERALQDNLLPHDTTVERFSVGVGVESGVAIITIVGIVKILKDGPAAWSTVKRWAAVLRRTVGRNAWYRMNVATLKLLCIDDVLRVHPNLTRMEAALVTASVAVETDPETLEEGLRGPVYVVVPVADVGTTYIFAIGWDGQIRERTNMPYVNSSD